MAGNGPPPAEQRRRRNGDTYADVQATVPRGDATVRGPRLPEGNWLEATRSWWDTWRRAPQAATFLDTDWQRLRMLLPLVDGYFRRPHFTKLAEIRLNEALLGATHVDRLKARIKVETTPATVTGPGVTAMDDYRNRLGA